MHRLALAVVFALVGPLAAGQEPPAAPPPAPAAAAPADAERARAWSFDLSAFTVNPPDDDSYVTTVVSADREALHLEGRWNYEDLHTASFWVGWNLDWPARDEKDFGLAVTPMFGVVTGDTDGLAPGLELDATWRCFELYSEMEYLLDAHHQDDDFFYSWSELTAAPVDWLRFGFVAQRTNARNTELSVDRGLLFGLSFRNVSGTVYWFNPDDDDDYFMFTVGFSF